ncbi:hypothetical protein MHYP_G00333590 [Metynnis hypsauchen]
MLTRVAKPWIIVPVQLMQPRPSAEPALARTSDSHTTTVSIPVAKSLHYSNNKPVLGSDLDTVPVAGMGLFLVSESMAFCISARLGYLGQLPRDQAVPFFVQTSRIVHSVQYSKCNTG